MWNASVAGINAGWYTARRVFENPAMAHEEELLYEREAEYHLLWAYYNNSMFDKTARFMNQWSTQHHHRYDWNAYKSNYNLYKNIRLIYNPVRRLVDFYAGQVYPGLLSEDGAQLPDGVPLAIPFSEDTDPALKAAIAQFWQWSNWQAKKSLMVRYGAALGNVLVELIDDVKRGKIVADVVWPGFVRCLELDNACNLKSYSLQYRVRDEEETYLYRKDVDQQTISYFKDDKPFDYGYGAVTENIYGFVPAVWVQHQDTGGDHGSPAMSGASVKIDELNNLASHAHDQIHKIIGAPLVMWSDGAINNLFGKKPQGSSDFERPSEEQENLLLLKGPAGGSVSSLAGDLDLAESKTYIDGMLAEIEKDFPELTVFEQLRSMTQVTGPAAERLAAPATNRLTDAQASYDTASISIFRMAVAIAGFRANSGAWGPALNRQRQKFTPFNLDSYERGDLDMAIMPRPLLVPTKQERSQERLAMWTGVKMATDAGAPLEIVLKDEGWTDKEIAELQEATDRADTLQVQRIQQKQMLAQQDVVPAQEQ